jgi:uncharacterized protein with HEPN domain
MLLDDLTGQSPHIPWQDIAGMRDKLIYDYFGVDIDTVWLTVKKISLILKKKLNELLRGCYKLYYPI